MGFTHQVKISVQNVQGHLFSRATQNCISGGQWYEGQIWKGKWLRTRRRRWGGGDWKGWTGEQLQRERCQGLVIEMVEEKQGLGVKTIPNSDDEGIWYYCINNKRIGNIWKLNFRHVSPRFKAFIPLEIFFWKLSLTHFKKKNLVTSGKLQVCWASYLYSAYIKTKL